MGKGRRYKIWMRCGLAAFIMSGALFLVLLQMEKNALSGYEQGTVWVAAQPIPKGMELTEANLEQYVQTWLVDVNCIPKAAVVATEELQGETARYGIDSGSILTAGMFLPRQQALDGLEHPVVASIKAEDLQQAVGGVLRTGDYIDIYILKETGETILLWEKLYVQKSFDSSGNPISAEDSFSAASRINLYLDSKDVQAFYNGMAEGTLRIVKRVGE